MFAIIKIISALLCLRSAAAVFVGQQLGGGGHYGPEFGHEKLLYTQPVYSHIGSPRHGLGYSPTGQIGGPLGYSRVEVGPTGYERIGYSHIEGPSAGLGYGHVGFPYALGGPKYIGGSEVDREIFNKERKEQNDERFEKAYGDSGVKVNHGELGYSKGSGAFNDVKGESGHYHDVDGEKNEYFDGKGYVQEKNFDQEGKAGAEKSLHQGHKKGHNTKGFTKSHHSEESGKTEEFYDEEHDEGGNVAFDGHKGEFGESGASTYKGGHEDDKYNEREAKKGTKYQHEYADGKAHGNHGHFDGNKYTVHGSVLGEHKLVGEDDVAGHYGTSKFFKQGPSYY